MWRGDGPRAAQNDRNDPGRPSHRHSHARATYPGNSRQSLLRSVLAPPLHPDIPYRPLVCSLQTSMPDHFQVPNSINIEPESQSANQSSFTRKHSSPSMRFGRLVYWGYNRANQEICENPQFYLRIPLNISPQRLVHFRAYVRIILLFLFYQRYQI